MNKLFSAIKEKSYTLISNISNQNPSIKSLFHLISKKGSRSLKNEISIPMEWLDNSEAGEKYLLRQGGVAEVHLANFVGAPLRAVIKVKLPDVNYHFIKNVQISITSSSFIVDSDKIIVERVMNADQYKFVYNSGHLLSHDIKTALVRIGDSEVVEKGIFVGGNGSFNYFHWVVEILPKLQFLSTLPASLKNYPLLVSEDVENIPAFKDILNLLIKDNNIIFLKKNARYMVNNLVYINSPSYLPFNLRAGETCDSAYTIISKESVMYIRDAVLSKIVETKKNGSYPKRIFLARKEIRRCYNQDEVYSFLEKFGFMKVFLEDVSFQQQVNMIHQAEWIVGPTGAAWTNLIFCQEGTKCLCWMAEEFPEFSVYSTLAGLVGANLRYAGYKTGVFSSSELYEREYRIDINRIEAGLYDLDENISRCH